MYTYSILWLLSWPVFIVASYLIIRFALKRFEKKDPTSVDASG